VDSLVAKDESAKPKKSPPGFSKLLKPHFGPREVQAEVCLWSGIWVDIFFPAHKAVVEMDGPYHYLSNGDKNGITLFKKRLLEGAGYRVFPVMITVLTSKSQDERKKFAAVLAGKIKGPK
jgi:hypothetical protein